MEVHTPPRLSVPHHLICTFGVLLLFSSPTLQDATPAPFLGINLPSGSMKFFGPTFRPQTPTYKNDWKPIPNTAEPRSFGGPPPSSHEHVAPHDQQFYSNPTPAGSYQHFVNFNDPSASYRITTPSTVNSYSTPFPYYQTSAPTYQQPSFATFQQPLATSPSYNAITESPRPFVSFGSKSQPRTELASPKAELRIEADESADQVSSHSANPYVFSVFNDNFSLPSFNVFQSAIDTGTSAPQEKQEQFIPTESLEFHTEPTKSENVKIEHSYRKESSESTTKASIFHYFNDKLTPGEFTANTLENIGELKISENVSNENPPVSEAEINEELRDNAELDLGGEKISLEEILFANTTYEDFEEQRKELEDFWTILNEENEYLNSLDNPELQRSSRQTKKPKDLSGLIQKALKLVRRVEEIGERKRTIETVRTTEPTGRTTSIALDEIKNLKEDQRFSELKNLIQNQNSLSSLIKSETSSLRDLLKDQNNDNSLSGARGTVNKISKLLGLEPREKGKKKPSELEMLKALAKLNDISSLLLRENDQTRSQVREIPAEIRVILDTEMNDLREILETQNQNVGRQLDKVLRFGESQSSIGSDTEIVILRALAKLNEISGVLLKEQEKNEKQTDKALKALPALAQFIQAETAEIKELISIQGEDNEEENQELEDLKKSVRQSLANDKLITRAIIKLNDITQLLLKDVNFTTTAVTNKLPAALTALITSETTKIKDMIDNQNVAIVEFLKESKNLQEAERVIEGAEDIKKSLSEGEDGQPKSLKEKFLEVLAPIFKTSSAENKERIQKEEDEVDELIAALGPLIQERNQALKLEESNLEKEENNEIVQAQVEGQKSIVQALLKLTNITRTLLEEKETEKIREEAELKAKVLLKKEKEKTESRLLREREREEVRGGYRLREAVRGPVEYDFEDYDDPEVFEDDFYDYRTSNRPKTLIERVAGSSGSNKLQGNQALFEEFVKLAIERQRWENAAHVHELIQKTITTTPDPDSDEHSSEKDFDSNEEIRNGKKNKRPKRPESEEEYSEEVYDYESEEKDDRRRPIFTRNRNNEISSHSRSKDNRPFSNPRVRDREEYSEIEEEYYYEEEDNRRPSKPKRKQRPRTTRPPRRPTKPTRRTTEEPPIYEEYYEYPEEEYISEESYEEERPFEEKPRRFLPAERRPSPPNRLNIASRRPSIVPTRRSKRPPFEESRSSAENTRPLEKQEEIRPAQELRQNSIPPEEIKRPLESIEELNPENQGLIEQKEIIREISKPSVQSIRKPERKEERLVDSRQNSNSQTRGSGRPTAADRTEVKPIPEKVQRKNSFLENLRRINQERRNPTKNTDRPSNTPRPQPTIRPSESSKETNRPPPTSRPKVTAEPGKTDVTTSMDPLKLLQSLVDKKDEKETKKPKEEEIVQPVEAVTKAAKRTFGDLLKSQTTPRPPPIPVTPAIIASTTRRSNRIVGIPTRPSEETDRDVQKGNGSQRKGSRNQGPKRKQDDRDSGENEIQDRDHNRPGHDDQDRDIRISPKKQRPNMDPRKHNKSPKTSEEKIRPEQIPTASGPRLTPTSQSRPRPGPSSTPRPQTGPSSPSRLKAIPSSPPRPRLVPSSPSRPRPDPSSPSKLRPSPSSPTRPRSGSSSPSRPRPGPPEESRSEEVRSSRIGLPPRKNNIPSRPRPNNRNKPTEPPGLLIIEEVTAKTPIFSPPQANSRGKENRREEKERPKEVTALSQEEKEQAKKQRDNLLNLFKKNRPGRPDRPGRPNRPDRQQRPERPDSPPSRPGSKPSRPESGPPRSSDVNPLANLFNIATNKQESDDSKTVVKVTSSSSTSSSSSSRRIGPGQGRGGKGERRKKKKKAKARPTSNPNLRDLSPQQRLVQKVMETLNQNKEGGAAAGSQQSLNDGEGPVRKKKIILRKKKNPLSRSGRVLEDGSKMKHIKVRVRRPHTPPPFPIVY